MNNIQVQQNLLVAPNKLNGKARAHRIIGLVVKYVIAAVICVFLLFPYMYMLNKSLMSFVEVSAGATFWTRSFTLQNYAIVGRYLRNIGNTLLIVIINGFFVPFTGLFCAFPLARIKFAGKKVTFALLMSTVMIPSTVLMVPTFILFKTFGLYDNIASQFIGAFWGGGALNIFLAIQFMRSIPKEIDNAAKIDGANWFQIYFRIMLPLCFNIFLYIAITMVIGLWMDFQGPLIYLATEKNFTIGLKFYHDLNNASQIAMNELMAMCVFTTVLPMILFFSFQKQMIGGIQVGSLK